MKKTYKYLFAIALNGLLCLFIALPADAQHRDGGGGGGGGGGSRSSGSSSSGGGSSRASSGSSNSGSVSRPSGSNNGGSFSRPPGSNGGYRPAGSFNRPSVNGHVAIAPPRVNSQGIRPAIGFNGGRQGAVNIATSSANGRSYVNSNARSYVGTRGYIGAGGRASVGVGGRGFSGPSYWRNTNYYHYYRGYYNTYYGPRLGFSIGFLPYGYYPFYFGDFEYFYSNGLYYQYDNSQYTVVEPPIGAEITTLPDKAQSIVINGQQYYELNGVYYQPITKDDGSVTYEIAGKDGELNTNTGTDVQQAPQIGDIVDALPEGCRTIKLNGEKFYVSTDGYYYQDALDANHNKVYKIVGTPADEPQN
jgi:hypothetical protein